MEGVTGMDRMLLLTAAWFHDLGFTRQITDHELVSINIAREVLPGMGYSPEQVEVISGIILATRLPQTPLNLMESIMADADLDVLGREDYVVRNQALRDEMALTGIVYTDKGWYLNQLDFVGNHRYFTDAAHALRDAGKEHNLDMVRGWLAETESQDE